MTGKSGVLHTREGEVWLVESEIRDGIGITIRRRDEDTFIPWNNVATISYAPDSVIDQLRWAKDLYDEMREGKF